MKKTKLSFIAITLIMIAASCKKDDTNTTAPKVTTGVYELNQGDFSSSNSTLTYYDFSTATVTTDFFTKVNSFGLGATGSDFIIYGSKMYIVMNVSGYVAIANAITAKLIDTVNFTGSGINEDPQNVVASGSNIFVSSTQNNSVYVIDTASLKTVKVIPVGSNPAQMLVLGNNLYVSNTGGYSVAFDSTVAVINLSTLTETTKIKVGVNPGSIAADNSGNLYIACSGDYNTVVGSLVKVNTATNAVTKSADTTSGIVRFYNNNLYVTGGYYGISKVRVLSTIDFSAIKTNFVNDGTNIVSPYGLDIDGATGDVYIGDAIDAGIGEVYCFDKNGNKKFSFATQSSYPIKTVLIQQ
jgi:YVTN family beta-propeller protein